MAERRQTDATTQPQEPTDETGLGGGWTAIAAEAAATHAQAPLGLAAPARAAGALGRLWHRLTDAEARGQMLRGARDRLARTVETFRHPPMTGAMTGSTPGKAPPPAMLPQAMSEPDQAPPFDPDIALARLESALRQLPALGDVTVPANLQALDRLLGDPPPALDFEAVDLLHDCFPRGTRHSTSRVLLAVARNLTRNFGQPGRLPMASGKAWTMLDPAVFADQMATQLAAINAFIVKWQAEEKSFLILEFAEVELIEYLFEHLHPRRHGGLLVRVMDFKVLSARRVGLLRRIPARVRRYISHTAGSDPAVPLTYARDCVVMLQAIERAAGFHLVTEAAAIARGEIEKIIERLAPAAPAPPARTAPAPPPPAAPPRAVHPRLDQIVRTLSPDSAPPVAPKPISAVPLPVLAPQPLSVTAAPPPATLPVPVPRKRFGNKDKIAAVMRVLQGEDRDWVAASVGTSPQMLEGWRDAFLDGGVAALGARPKEPKKTKKPAAVEEASIDDLKAKLHALIQTVEVLSSQIQTAPEAPPPPAMLPLGFPAEDPDPPPRPKRTRKPPRR